MKTVAELEADLTAKLPLKYDDGSPRDPRIWPTGQRAIQAQVVSRTGKREYVTIYRNYDRTLFAMKGNGVKFRVSFDQITWKDKNVAED